MGGPLWARRDAGAWTIPKGLIEIGEDPFEAALREFEEEVGSRPEGDPIELSPIKQKSGKQILAWAIEGDLDPSFQRSNKFTMEWPPRSGKFQQFPEVDRVDWFTIEEACSKAITGQSAFFRELEMKLRSAE